MKSDIRNISDMNRLITYFVEVLNWDMDQDEFEDIEDISYDFEAEDLGLKEEAFAKIKSLRQLPPLVDGQKWGIFSVEFDSKKFEITALRKVLSGLIPKKRNSADHAVWDQKDLLFICFWGADNNRTIGIAHFEDKEVGLPQIKMIYCAPAIEDQMQIQSFELKLKNLTWPLNVYDTQKWHDDWAKAFTTGYRQTIHDASTLTIQLAEEARAIRDRILKTLEVETENGYVHQLYQKFKDTLIHDMNETQFADMYSQTVVYGLFSARCMDDSLDNFSATEAVECIPNTNPFLKSLMRECLGSQNNSLLSYDELEISNVIDLLINTDTKSIIQDFNRLTGGGREDPVIHFYEEFLTAYDKAQKVQRGVYYTPQPVVNFIVSAVDSIIKNEFGLIDGLASIETKKVKFMRDSKKKKDGLFLTKVEDSKDVPAIQILDPSTGTGTFLRKVILQIHDNFIEKNKGLTNNELKKAWNEYVPKHLLPRLNGFELMMAPYAVAHMKLAMVLKDTEYNFESNERLNVYLTNTLEEPGNSDGQMTLFDDPLASESIAANVVKKNNGINIVIGNPPYSGGSTNKGEWILGLIEEYRREPGGKEKLKEVKTHIDNDYVKFIRYAQKSIEQSGEGIVAYINPRDYLYSPTYRGMRWNLLDFFDEIYVIDLNGDMRQNKNSINEDVDENVFDIQVGVCIELLVKHKGKKKNSLADVYHYEVRGDRNRKFDFLNCTDFSSISFEKMKLMEPFYSFKPQYIAESVFEDSFSVNDLFCDSVNGIQTGRDVLTIRNTPEEMKETIKGFIKEGVEEVREKYNIGKDGRDWKVDWAQRDVREHLNEKNIIPILYRPFDVRWTYYTGPIGKGFLQCPRGTIMQSMVSTENYALVIGRQGQAVGNIEWCLAFISMAMPTDLNLFYRGGGMVFPLYRYSYEFGVQKKKANINEELAKKIASLMGSVYMEKCVEQNQDTITPEDLMYYIYAVLYSKKYRKEFADLLQLDFPKIPFPHDIEYFHNMIRLGRKLIGLHTMSKMDYVSSISLSGSGNDIVDKYKHSDNKVWINRTQYFSDVEKEVWDFYVGGYQPLQKWLKDRKNLVLTKRDINHYGQMIDSIKQSITTMMEIDTIIRI